VRPHVKASHKKVELGQRQAALGCFGAVVGPLSSELITFAFFTLFGSTSSF